MTAALTRALDLRGRELGVIPVPRPNVATGHDGKRPVIAWRPYQDRLPDESEIVAWFETEQNVAVITGAVSGVIVIDADTPEAVRWCVRRLPYTPWQTRTPRGWHLWYRHPGVRVSNRARIDTGAGRLAIDVRGDGGYVIAPGSVHASGVLYEYAGDWSVSRDALPRFWPGWLERPAREQTPHVPRGTRPAGDVVDRARRYLAAIPPPVIGAGSDAQTLYAACRLIRGFGLSGADAVALLWEWAGGRPGWDRAWISRKVRSAERYGTEPIGGLLA